eukprot:m.291235 g.291235  ORF g.291235 m.291235 type:complete len:59 (-) comp15825_c2_seq5:462-638(-)
MPTCANMVLETVRFVSNAFAIPGGMQRSHIKECAAVGAAKPNCTCTMMKFAEQCDDSP